MELNHGPEGRSYPLGFRFDPTDQQLIYHYLKKRTENQQRVGADVCILDANVYKFNPWELTAMYPTMAREEWYFFTERERKYPNGSRPSRTAGDGYWKATVADRMIHHKSVCIGFKKTLVFYIGKSSKGQKTNWIMHEYTLNRSLPNDSMQIDDCVLCRIHERKRAHQESSNEHQLMNIPTPLQLGSCSQHQQQPPLVIPLESQIGMHDHQNLGALEEDISIDLQEFSNLLHDPNIYALFSEFHPHSSDHIISIPPGDILL